MGLSYSPVLVVPIRRPMAKVLRPSALIDTRVIYCGDNLEKLAALPDDCIDLIYIDPPFNSNRDYEVFWGEATEKRRFEDTHASAQAYIEYMRPRCVQLHRVLKSTGSFYYHCDDHASHYVKVMLERPLPEGGAHGDIPTNGVDSPDVCRWRRIPVRCRIGGTAARRGR